MKKFLCLLIIAFCCIIDISAQVDQSKTGAWYMYFYRHQFKDSQFGIQGDLQHRNWNTLGDLEQLLIRSGLTFTPKKTNVLLTLGYANITTGQYGDSKATVSENRIYQEAFIPQKLGGRLYLAHRFRYEQRFVENQDFRTRYRYNLFLNIPLNQLALIDKTVYIALYNELFINGQTDIGNNNTVQLFDRNRTYLGIGYVIKPGKRIQFGWMNQKTNNWGKGQLQLSFHHSF
ncbi:DUF2490 domain-containing protein [Hyunsoonleella flava]|uniref:DUF2490 domain-containing protein n=1 Tax=Hyunsoonleella flava TaxID=2527939 RepID=A0A4Q9FLT3_9FLAO|nr:DUF2490 domain-containing protein [Hyunsoonleella flava]TBN06680.1 DUF2490 domain-containing protein [Hyunsoonleella flava]